MLESIVRDRTQLPNPKRLPLTIINNPTQIITQSTQAIALSYGKVPFNELLPIDKLLSTEAGGQEFMLKDAQIVSISPEIMGGTPVFWGTRVPIQTLMDYLKAGESIDDFLDGFPTVTREQVVALLEEVGKQLSGMVA